jgi:hypothetical protein
MVVAAPLLVLGSPQAAACCTPAGYGYQTAAVVTPVAVRRPVAAAAVVRRGGVVVPRVGSGARIRRTGPGNRGLGR